MRRITGFDESIFSDFGNGKCSWATWSCTWKMYYSVPKVGLSKNTMECVVVRGQMSGSRWPERGSVLVPFWFRTGFASPRTNSSNCGFQLWLSSFVVCRPSSLTLLPRGRRRLCDLSVSVSASHLLPPASHALFPERLPTPMKGVVYEILLTPIELIIGK